MAAKRKNVSQEFIDDSDDPDDEGVSKWIVKHGTDVLAPFWLQAKTKKKKTKQAAERGIGAALLNKKTVSDIEEDELIPVNC